MSTKISELPNATSLTGDEEIPIVQTGTTKKTTANMIKSVAYSTTEQVVGTWIDGKPLYRIILNGSFPQVTTDGTQVANYQDLISLSIDKAIIEWSGTFNSAQTAFQPFPIIRKQAGTTLEFIARVIFSDNKLYCYNNLTSYNTNTWWCSLLYTKTTDTATRSLNLTRTANTEEIEEKGLVEETKQEKTIEPAVEDIKEENSNAEGSGDVK